MTGLRSGGGPGRLEILPATDRNAPEIAEFIRAVWTPSATPESVVASRAEAARRNWAEPGVPPPTFIALRAGRVLGYVTTIPVRLWDGEREWPAYLIKGLMVHPEFRNGPIGYLVMKAAAARLPRTGALAVALPARRLFEALGYEDVGAVPNWIRPIAAGRVLQRVNLAELGLAEGGGWIPSLLGFAQATGLASLAGWTGGLCLRAASSAMRLPAVGLDAGPLAPTAHELDALWRSARSAVPAAVVRDGAYLLNRYSGETDNPYSWIGVRDHGVLAGVAILRRPRPDGDLRLRGIRLATLADILYHPHQSAAGLALLGGVEHAARRSGADAILASGSASTVQRRLRSQGYFPIAGNVHFLLRDVTGESAALRRPLADWWLTRGDGLADEVF